MEAEVSEREKRRLETQRRLEKRKQKVLGSKGERIAQVLGQEYEDAHPEELNIEIGSADDAQIGDPAKIESVGSGSTASVGFTEPFAPLLSSLGTTSFRLPLSVRMFSVSLLVYVFWILSVRNSRVFFTAFVLLELMMFGIEYIMNLPLPKGRIPLLKDSEVYFSGLVLMSRSMKFLYSAYKDTYIAGFMVIVLTSFN